MLIDPPLQVRLGLKTRPPSGNDERIYLAPAAAPSFRSHFSSTAVRVFHMRAKGLYSTRLPSSNATLRQRSTSKREYMGSAEKPPTISKTSLRMLKQAPLTASQSRYQFAPPKTL